MDFISKRCAPPERRFIGLAESPRHRPIDAIDAKTIRVRPLAEHNNNKTTVYSKIPKRVKHEIEKLIMHSTLIYSVPCTSVQYSRVPDIPTSDIPDTVIQLYSFIIFILYEYSRIVYLRSVQCYKCEWVSQSVGRPHEHRYINTCTVLVP